MEEEEYSGQLGHDRSNPDHQSELGGGGSQMTRVVIVIDGGRWA